MIKRLIEKNGLLAFWRMAQALDRRFRSMVATHAWRKKAIHFGMASIVQDRVFVEDITHISVGKQCLIGSNSQFTTEISTASVTMGSGVQINRDVHIDYTGGLLIGDNVLISEAVVLYTHDHGLDPRSEPISYQKNIAQGAWIGARAILLPNCRIVGESAIIGAGSVVTSDVPPKCIYAGNPARLIRSLEAP